MRALVSDPDQPDAPGLRLEVGADETVGQLADRAAEKFARGADAGVITLQQGFVRHPRTMPAELLDQDTDSLLVV